MLSAEVGRDLVAFCEYAHHPVAKSRGLGLQVFGRRHSASILLAVGIRVFQARSEFGVLKGEATLKKVRESRGFHSCRTLTCVIGRCPYL